MTAAKPTTQRRLRNEHELLVDPNDPWANDKLGRHKVGTAMTELLGQIDTSFVISLDDAWGSGKTTFCRMWRDHLNASGFDAIYFSAWESDFTEDALVSVVSELQLRLEGLEGRADEGARAAVREAATDVIRALGRGVQWVRDSLPTLGAAAAGVAADCAVPGSGAVVAPAIATVTAPAARVSAVSEYDARRATLVAFKRAVAAYVSLPARPATNPDNPIVVIIDELDRCRPTFAVEVLEVVKHLFSVDGLVFVVALDRTQLAHSVKAVYGEGCDADGYLRRFFDIDLRLPPAPSLTEFVSRVVERVLPDAIESTGRKQWPAIEIGILLVGAEGLALRDVERFALRLAWVLRVQTEVGVVPLLLTWLHMRKPGVLELVLRDRSAASEEWKQSLPNTSFTWPLPDGETTEKYNFRTWIGILLDELHSAKAAGSLSAYKTAGPKRFSANGSNAPKVAGLVHSELSRVGWQFWIDRVRMIDALMR